MSEYQRLTDKSRISFPYVIESSWTEETIHWFKVRETHEALTLYTLLRLTDSGNTYESFAAWEGYLEKPENAWRHEVRKREPWPQ